MLAILVRGPGLRRPRPRGRRLGGDRPPRRPATDDLPQSPRQAGRGKSRLHIDVNPTDRDQDAELGRLLGICARPVDIGQTGEESWHVLVDPEGNEFCLLRSRRTALCDRPCHACGARHRRPCPGYP
ncbi:VOC family protein [Actinoplanes sp. NPDC051494]|uniref:VOC family protein n=1 Tax=Actinoplanes sp. NPDC051494 TaxID=3363907 RepID=UPI0037AACF25